MYFSSPGTKQNKTQTQHIRNTRRTTPRNSMLLMTSKKIHCKVLAMLVEPRASSGAPGAKPTNPEAPELLQKKCCLGAALESLKSWGTLNTWNPATWLACFRLSYNMECICNMLTIFVDVFYMPPISPQRCSKRVRRIPKAPQSTQKRSQSTSGGQPPF